MNMAKLNFFSKCAVLFFAVSILSSPVDAEDKDGPVPFECPKSTHLFMSCTRTQEIHPDFQEIVPKKILFCEKKSRYQTVYNYETQPSELGLIFPHELSFIPSEKVEKMIKLPDDYSVVAVLADNHDYPIYAFSKDYKKGLIIFSFAHQEALIQLSCQNK